MANAFAKLTTPALEKKIFSASPEDKVLIQEVLDKRSKKSAAASDFEEPVAVKAKPAKAAKAPKAVKAEAKPVKAAKAEKPAKAKKARNILIGRTAEFTIHGTALKLKGPIVRVITGTDGLPYIGIADSDGKVKFKKQEASKIFEPKSK